MMMPWQNPLLYFTLTCLQFCNGQITEAGSILQRPTDTKRNATPSGIGPNLHGREMGLNSQIDAAAVSQNGSLTFDFNTQNDQPVWHSLMDTKLRRMGPSVLCSLNSMRLRVKRGKTPRFLVDTGNGSLVPLSRMPPHCGFSTRRSRRDVLHVPYQGCNVTKQGGNYVLPLHLWGAPMTMSCPVAQPPPPSVSCFQSGMVVKIGGVAKDELKVKVSGVWEPVSKVGGSCGLFVEVVSGHLVLTAPYNMGLCIEIMEGGERVLSLLLADGELVATCHTRPASPTSTPTTTAPDAPFPQNPRYPRYHHHPQYPHYSPFAIFPQGPMFPGLIPSTLLPTTTTEHPSTVRSTTSTTDVPPLEFPKMPYAVPHLQYPWLPWYPMFQTPPTQSDPPASTTEHPSTTAEHRSTTEGYRMPPGQFPKMPYPVPHLQYPWLPWYPMFQTPPTQSDPPASTTEHPSTTAEHPSTTADHPSTTEGHRRPPGQFPKIPYPIPQYPWLAQYPAFPAPMQSPATASASEDGTAPAGQFVQVPQVPWYQLPGFLEYRMLPGHHPPATTDATTASGTTTPASTEDNRDHKDPKHAQFPVLPQYPLNPGRLPQSAATFPEPIFPGPRAHPAYSLKYRIPVMYPPPNYPFHKRQPPESPTPATPQITTPAVPTEGQSHHEYPHVYGHREPPPAQQQPSYPFMPYGAHYRFGHQG